MANASLPFVAAPMVNQSDLPFRLLARKHGATMTYTQMLVPEMLLNDQDYLEYHIRDLTAASADPLNGPVVVQLCGHDPETIVQAGKKLQNYCTAIGAAARYRRQFTFFIQHVFRPQSWMPAGSGKRWPLRSIPLASTGLALGGEYRYRVLSCSSDHNKRTDVQYLPCITPLRCSYLPSSVFVSRFPRRWSSRGSWSTSEHRGSRSMLVLFRRGAGGKGQLILLKSNASSRV
jgi:hypothetical protein